MRNLLVLISGLVLVGATYAFADGTASKAGFDFMQFLPLIAIFGIFYFLLIRPQQKKMKLHRQMLGNIRRGDRVITAGGIIGTISKVESNDELHVDIGSGVVVRVVRSTVSQVVDKTAPTASGSPESGKEKLALKKPSSKQLVKKISKSSGKSK